jgi:hypothetical protein
MLWRGLTLAIIPRKSLGTSARDGPQNAKRFVIQNNLKYMPKDLKVKAMAK